MHIIKIYKKRKLIEFNAWFIKVPIKHSHSRKKKCTKILNIEKNKIKDRVFQSFSW